MKGGSTIRRVVTVITNLLGWAAVGGVGLVMLTQAVGWNGSRTVAALQALTPYAIALVLSVALLAVLARRQAMAATAAVVGIGAFVLSMPLVVIDGTPPVDESTELRVASVNLLYSNPVIDEAADVLLELDPDVIVFSEYTSEHRDALLAHPLADRYRSQVNRDRSIAGGMAVWSKVPFVEDPAPGYQRNVDGRYVPDSAPPDSRTIDLVLALPEGPLRVLSVHPSTPIYDFDSWLSELEFLATTAPKDGTSTLMLGDFNAGYWHPAFRDLLDAGYEDAHISLGSGWSTSYPSDRVFPPFVRLDHALTDGGLVATDVHDFRVPGSDHVGFVVTVAQRST